MLVSAVQQSESAICIHISSPSGTFLPPPLPIPPSRSSQSTKLSSLFYIYSKFPLAIYFTHGSVFMLSLISKFIAPSPSHPVTTCLFSASVCRFLPWKYVHLYHFSRFYIYVLIYDIFFSFQLTLLHITACRSIHISTEDSVLFLFYGWVIIPLHISIT